ncbi:hypothetical protein VBQ89_09285 [Klebsiella pneumoniae]|uniref:hypothetical protein n=1 Tax=Klebsiella pneumoniae TaxID=573 RepID=UPI002D7C7070|nr:hypothetical protein [Klebsiella pneumoniae]MEA4391283.1 hypothetical protein [Klebsiella pneumoniae]MEA4583410.1 hypothetical protein [Klebsiella pneumoniae]MEA4703679.1 hypothetical protein [Klebsiella pneumoniae]
MTKTAITRGRLQEIAEDGFLKHGESKELARMALAAMDSEPVAWTWHYREQWHVTNDKCRAEFVATDGDVAVLPLYRHAQPAPEYPETLPCPVLLEPGLRFGKGIKTSTMLAALARRAVYESDMAALSPEERAEFQARIEDFKALIAQPVPVVSADLLHTAASAIEDLLEHTDPNTSYYSGVWADVPGKLRAAMLQTKSLTSINPAPALVSLQKKAKSMTGNSPVIGIDLASGPDRTVEVHYVVPPGYVMVPKEPTDEMIAAAMNCEDVLFNSDDSFCVQFVNIYEAMLAAAPKEVK